VGPHHIFCTIAGTAGCSCKNIRVRLTCPVALCDGWALRVAMLRCALRCCEGWATLWKPSGPLPHSHALLTRTLYRLLPSEFDCGSRRAICWRLHAVVCCA
jgi:hypothetical protein